MDGMDVRVRLRAGWLEKSLTRGKMNAAAVGVLDKTTELINHGAHRSSSSYDLPAGSAASSFIAQPRLGKDSLGARA